MKTAQEYFDEGNSKFQNNDYEGAIKEYDEAIKINSKHVDAYINRGSAKDRLKRYKEALLDFDQAIKLAPTDTDAYNNRGLIKHELKLYKEALSDYAEAIKLDLKNTNAYFNSGNANLELKEYNKAVENYDKALKLDPNNPQAIHNKAYAIGLRYSEGYTKQFKKAGEDYKHRQRKYKWYCIIMNCVIFIMIFGLFLFLFLLVPSINIKSDFDLSTLLGLISRVSIVAFPWIWGILILLKNVTKYHALAEDSFTKQQVINFIGSHPIKDEDKNYQVIRDFIEYQEKRSTADIVMGIKPPSVPQQEIVRAVEKVIKSDKPD